MRVPRVIATAGFAACLGFAVVGCGNDNNQTALPSVATSDSATPSATPTSTTPGAILGYVPKTDDEREILEQYDAFNEMIANIYVIEKRRRDRAMAPMVDQKLISSFTYSISETDKTEGFQRGKPIPRVKSIVINSDKAEITDCSNQTKVETVNRSTDSVVDTGDPMVSLMVKFTRSTKNVWLVSSYKKGGMACQ